jgi:hypothetical protein
MKRDLQVDYLFTNKDGKELAVISIFKKNCEE